MSHSWHSGTHKNWVRDLATRVLTTLAAALFVTCTQVQAGEPEASTKLQALGADLRWLDYRLETQRQDAGYLLKKHGVSEEELLRAAKGSDKLGWEWRLVLVVGSQQAKREFVEWYDGLDDIAANKAGMMLGGPTFASPELSTALLQYMEKALTGPVPRRYQLALKAVAQTPVPEAVSVLEHFFLRLKPSYACYGARGLGKLSSPAALSALKRCWLDRERLEYTTLCSLADAIGSCGNDGVEVLRQVYRARGNRSYVLLALRRIATPDALRFAMEIAAERPDDVNCRMALLRVEVAVGEAKRSTALLQAMSSDVAPDRGEAFSILGDMKYPPSREVRKAVVRVSLTPDDPCVRSALMVLGTWSYRGNQREKEEHAPWSEAVNGIALSPGPVTYHGRGDEAYLKCHVRIRNQSDRSARMALGGRMWSLLTEGEPPLRQLQHPEARVHDSILAPGAAISTSTIIKIVPVSFDGRRPIRFRLKLTIRDKDYRFTRGWVGSALSPEFEFYVPPPEVSNDLAHWREFLNRIRETGLLPAGSSISWRTGGRGFTVRGPTARQEACEDAIPTVACGGQWLALPDDLYVLNVGEVKRIAGYLAEEDRFANAIDWYDGPIGKYMARAEIRLESASRIGCWGQYQFKRDVSEALNGIVMELLRPRLSEARKRLGIPEPKQPAEQ